MSGIRWGIGWRIVTGRNNNKNGASGLPRSGDGAASSPARSGRPDVTLSVSDPGPDPGVVGFAPPPDTVRGFRMIRVLGEGGMGVVWEAEQESPRRRVALKITQRDHRVDDSHLRMPHREVEMLARLDHPNIAAIYSSGLTDQDHDYFAMELVSGETLDRWLQRRPENIDSDELELRLRLFRTVCDGVHHAHQRGVIHCDLNPTNLVVSDETSWYTAGSSSVAVPIVKILDFGLACMPYSGIAATTGAEARGIHGTLQYMSPEQALGDVRSVDVRSDVYALGMILYELLAGRHAYDVTSDALVEAVQVICDEPPRPLGASWRGTGKLDAGLESIVGKALEKEMDRRHGSAAALGEDVDRVLAQQRIPARSSNVA